MKKDGTATDGLVSTWVEGLLQSPNQLLALPLSNHYKSPWGVNIASSFLAKEISITIVTRPQKCYKINQLND